MDGILKIIFGQAISGFTIWTIANKRNLNWPFAPWSFLIVRSFRWRTIAQYLSHSGCFRTKPRSFLRSSSSGLSFTNCLEHFSLRLLRPFFFGCSTHALIAFRNVSRKITAVLSFSTLNVPLRNDFHWLCRVIKTFSRTLSETDLVYGRLEWETPIIMQISLLWLFAFRNRRRLVN